MCMICRHLILKNGCCFTWFFPLTLQNWMLCHINPSANFIKTLARSRSNACTVNISLYRHIHYLSAAVRWDRDAARCVRIPSWTSALCRPSPGALSPLRCAGIETSLTVVLADFMSSDRPRLIGPFEDADQNR